jgi:hypothetical protein
MNKSSLPAFTAELSLYKSNGRHRQMVNAFAVDNIGTVSLADQPQGPTVKPFCCGNGHGQYDCAFCPTPCEMLCQPNSDGSVSAMCICHFGTSGIAGIVGLGLKEGMRAFHP